MLSTITSLITGNEETKNIYLYKGSSADILFLYYLNLYQTNDLAIAKGLELSTQIYNAYRQNKYCINYHEGLIGSVSVFQNLDKFGIADTDVSGSFKQLDEIIFQKLIFGEMNSLSLENGITGILLFLVNRLDKCDTDNLNLEQIKHYEALILAIDELERQTGLPGTEYFREDFPMNEAHILDLSKAMLLLAKILKKALYPEITHRIFTSIETCLQQMIEKNDTYIQPLKFNLLYHLWQSNNLLDRTEESYSYLSKIYEFENRRTHIKASDQNLFNRIQLIQQFNRLYWTTTDNYFNKIADKELCSLKDCLHGIEKFGLTGISGLGLTILSGLSKECLAWDETILLS